MATLPTRAQPDQGVGQLVGHCKSHRREGGVFAQRSPSRGPLQHGNGTGARAKERKRAIQEFRQTTAGDVRASILHRCLPIETLADDFLRTPDLGCDAWAFAPDVSTQCEKVMTFATEQNQVSNVGLALEIDWQRRMGIIAQRGLPLLPLRAKAETRAEQCRMAGECLCGAGGGKLRSFCIALMRLIKSQCSVGSRNPTTHENGSVVLVLLPRNLPWNCGGLAASDCAPPDSCEQTEAVTWLHMGLMNFSPKKNILSDLEVVCETSCGL